MINNPTENRQAFLDEITTAVNDRLTSQSLSTPPDFLYRWILEYVFDSYIIVPKKVLSDFSNAFRFSEIISQWANADISSDLIPAEQILQHLAQEGWIIIPPST